MPSIDDGVLAVVERLIDTLEGSGLTYAFGGAIALAAWSEPRATADVDVVQGASFDRAFVRAALVDMLDDDERIGAWDAICARVPLTSPG